jgi:thiol-disulfide isomerase/thioredoxin
LIASLVIIAVFAAAVKAFGLFKQWKMKNRSAGHILPAGAAVEEPTLLYFWSAGCSQCTPQERQIEQAKAMLQQAGKFFHVLKLNALEEEQLAKSMNVMTVPTTVLLDQQGRVAAWNPGLTQWKTIVEQYHTII